LRKNWNRKISINGGDNMSDKNPFARIMIAGTSSGVGKTTISMGIMAALTKRGLAVAPFKVGPDYIDPTFHYFATKNKSYNLDSYLYDKDTILYVLENGLKGKDIGVVEGVMGLYDGFGALSDEGSSAHIARLTDTPVILVIDGEGVSTSAAAMVLGYKNFNANVTISGVIINRVSSEEHYKILKTAIEEFTSIPCVGFFPLQNNINLNSRHLGLIPAAEVDEIQEKLSELAVVTEKYIDIDKLIDIAQIAPKLPAIKKTVFQEFIEENKHKYNHFCLGVAMDKAFSFYYESNFDFMKALNIEIVPFSPLIDERLPSNLDALYIGGGFPEVFAKELEANQPFKADLYDKLMGGMRCYAECGGLMYLTNRIIGLDKSECKMVGFINADSIMTERLQRFGYIEIEASLNNCICKIKGHEFHRSFIKENEPLKYAYKVNRYQDDKLISDWKCGIEKENTIAAYPHISFLSNPKVLENLLLKH
jgi:cobyrinic acid a,c-diamide synthase